MRYEIIKLDGLYCVFRKERYGSVMVSAHETLKKAKDAVAKYRTK